MTDVVDPATRSRMMSGIRGRDTKPEVIVRKFLHTHGFRYRIAPKDLPGKPDIVLPKYRTVVFVHGCFWHRHKGCRYATTPATNADFWRAKFQENMVRDQRTVELLVELGWKILTVWECEAAPEKLEWLLGKLRPGQATKRTGP
ncbi:MAG: very short patch repair endonuclease [Gammaproteobacteria bacterium]